MSILGRLGLWSGLDGLSTDEVVTHVRRVEASGYDTLWINETSGREPFAVLGALSRLTDRITLGVGIASIYARDAAASHAGARTIAELSGGRFVLGLGTSHPERVGPQRGHEYLPALSAMTAYLDAYEVAPYTAPLPVAEPPLVIAALRRRMVTLAGARTAGAFPFFVPLSYAARARAWVDEGATAAGRGTRPLLIVALPVVLADDPASGLAAARAYSAGYLRMVNYRANLLDCGYAEADFEPPGSERIMREVVAIGDVAEARARIAAFHEAGVDHVAIIPIGPDGKVAHASTVEALAP
ncbi:MAG TPA: LLM class flavin-dependent oxidoreductase [Candidatus Baltobacteraceae bacterium]|nr:LLM class flavin-dependent oxidoreductase [Candidatus Baltobacteraceae bacterium]